MNKSKLEKDEIIIFDKEIIFGKNNYEGILTLTNKNIILKREKGIFIKKLKVVDNIKIGDIKEYKYKVQVKQENLIIKIQTINKDYEIICKNTKDAKEIVKEIINIKTETTAFERTKNKILNTIKIVSECGAIYNNLPESTKEMGKEAVLKVIHRFNKK